MKGLFIPEITTEMFRNGCLESIEALMAEGKIYDIDYQQPCEDAISRQAVLNGLASIAKVKARSNAQKSLMGRIMFFVEQLPPVTPRSLNPEADREESKAYCAECDHIEMCSWYPHDGCEWLKTDRYNAGYNAAKREIALSGEYERAYERGKQDAEQPRWIPVSERLPEEFESVLVCYESQGGMAQAVSERFGTYTGYRWAALAGIEPIAWMPLPEPYKAESEVSNDTDRRL